MLSFLYSSVTALVGAGVLGSIAYLLVLTFAAAGPARRPSAPLAPRTRP